VNAPLMRIDTRPVVEAAGSHNVFMVVRNEAARLPYHLEYHRNLGIDRFCIVDNGSDDGTAELLLAQPDCHVFRTRESFAASGFGMNWINALGEQFGIGNWCLFVDADELFTFPHSESLSLPAFCRFLDQGGYEGLFSVMLDMYSRGPIANAAYKPGTPFLDTCPHFDRDYVIRRKSGMRGLQGTGAEYEVIGGPRLRKFYPEFVNTTQWQNLKRKARKYLPLYPFNHHSNDRQDIKAYPPELTKVPLVKGRSKRFWLSNHRSAPIRLPEITGALLHFKFFSDFHRRALIEVARGEHWNQGAEYLRYSNLLTTQPDTSLYYHGSEVYRSSNDLLRFGIMNTSPDLERYAGSYGHADQSNSASLRLNSVG
jgi:glycosyltransferase involved in cell wall biosynthesis